MEEWNKRDYMWYRNGSAWQEQIRLRVIDEERGSEKNRKHREGRSDKNTDERNVIE